MGLGQLHGGSHGSLVNHVVGHIGHGSTTWCVTQVGRGAQKMAHAG